MASRRYEYKHVDWSPKDGEDGDSGGFLSPEGDNPSPESLLNEMAKNGWRLTHAVTTSNGSYDQFILERPVAGDEPADG
ncbi:hypothetical protein BRD17_07120 [Halobacteriales archaeon SW_7_68_16]|nr:MAG: hypothetical protein BRD17_07120 [Halobacteriales archaeon SW_7_68_16]